MPALIHLLTADRLTASLIVCGDPTAATATWHREMVTCPACLGGRAPCTCTVGAPECAVCAAWRLPRAATRGLPRTAIRGRTHRTDGARIPIAARPLLRTEKQFQETIRQAALAGGWLYFHPQISLHSAFGYPDTTLVRLDPAGAGARLVFAELKMPGQGPTAAQQGWLDALRQITRVETFLWYPADLAQALEVLR